MRDPLMPPVLMLFGAAFVAWGGWQVRRALTRPNSEFSVDERRGRQGRLEGPLARLTHALDSLGILLVGVAAFALGFVDLLS